MGLSSNIESTIIYRSLWLDITFGIDIQNYFNVDIKIFNVDYI